MLIIGYFAVISPLFRRYFAVISPLLLLNQQIIYRKISEAYRIFCVHLVVILILTQMLIQTIAKPHYLQIMQKS